MTSPPDAAPAAQSDDGSPRNGLRALLESFDGGNPDEVLDLGGLLSDLRQSAFGMFLFVAVLPAFIPIPGVGGAISGPLTMLVGVQMIIGLSRPWVPGWIARRGPKRSTMVRFCHFLTPWFGRLEHLVKPRMHRLVDRRLPNAFSGLLIVLLGLLLALPIPLTNYLFGVLILAFALALLERDGALVAVSWVAGAIAVVVFGLLSGNLARMATHWVHTTPLFN